MNVLDLCLEVVSRSRRCVTFYVEYLGNR